MRKISVLAGLCLLPLAAFGQKKPDFTGDWTLDKGRSRFQLESAASLERGTVRIEHRDPVFKFHRTFTAKGEDDTYGYELTTDGKEVSGQEGAQKIFSRLYWEGETLVYSTRIVAPQGEATNVVHYRLLEAGRVLEAQERFRGPKLRYDNLWVFTKP